MTGGERPEHTRTCGRSAKVGQGHNLRGRASFLRRAQTHPSLVNDLLDVMMMMETVGLVDSAGRFQHRRRGRDGRAAPATGVGAGYSAPASVLSAEG